MQKLTTWFYLIIFSCLVFIPGISSIPTIDRDEAHFAQATVQMLETGNYFQIRFQDITRFQKPPGINWLQAASVKIFSSDNIHTIWSYRIPSVLSAILSVILIFFFAKRFMAIKTAAIAAALLGSTLLLILEAHMAVIDASLLCSVVLMQGALWVVYDKCQQNTRLPAACQRDRVSSLCFWLAMTYGFLLKGVTPLVGFLTIFSLCIIDKNIKLLKNIKFFSGLCLFIALTLLWLYFVNEAENSNYLLQIFKKDLLPKLQGGHESHGKPPLFHLFILPLTFWPASLFLWPAGVYAWKNRSKTSVKFLLAWILPTWIFFECMPTKLPQYLLPVFPAIAILAALALEDKNLAQGKTLKILQILWAILSIGLAFSFIIISYLISNQISLIAILLCTAVISLTLIVLYLAINKSDVLIPALFMLAFISSFLCFEIFLPSLKPIWISDSTAKTLKIYPKPLLVAGFDEPSLVFNLDTSAVKFTSIKYILDNLGQSSNFALVEMKALAGLSLPDDVKIIDKFQGFNYSKGKWVSLMLIGK